MSIHRGMDKEDVYIYNGILYIKQWNIIYKTMEYYAAHKKNEIMP